MPKAMPTSGAGRAGRLDRHAPEEPRPVLDTEVAYDLELAGSLEAARAVALRGRAVALDPAVRRWPNDLAEPVVKRPAIDMGQPLRPRHR